MLFKNLIFISSFSFIFLSCKTFKNETTSSVSAQYLDAEGVMNKSTFTVPAQIGRSAMEMEVVKTLNGLDLPTLRKFAFDNYQDGEDIEEPKHARAWVAGTPLSGSTLNFDDLDWGRKDHTFREAHPFIRVNVEDGRVRRTNSGNLKVTNGEDYFVDVYYDTESFDLHNNNIVVRQRIRLSDSNEVRRLLIQSKIGGGIDPQTGLKTVSKKDIRFDYSGADCSDTSSCWSKVDNMDKMIKTGMSSWSGSNKPIDAMQSVYEYLRDNAPDTLKGPDKELKLHGKAAVLSRRARYHLNTTSTDRNRVEFSKGKNLFSEVTALLEDSNLPNKEQLIETANNISQNDYIINQVRPKLEQIGQSANSTRWLPSNGSSFSSVDDANRSRVVSDYIYKVYHDFANSARDLENDFPEAQELLRKIEATGSLPSATWASLAGSYVGGQPSTWSNFIIDTFDYSQMMSVEEFKKLTNNEVRWQNFFDQNNDKYNVLDAKIVNEVQIELTVISPILEAVEKNTGEKKKLAQEVLDIYQNFQEDLANRRYDKLQDVLDDLGLPQGTWDNASGSKGQISIAAVKNLQTSSPVASIAANQPTLKTCARFYSAENSLGSRMVVDLPADKTTRRIQDITTEHDNKLSSVIVEKNCSVTLYTENNYNKDDPSGKEITYGEDFRFSTNLDATYNDNVNSIVCECE